MYEEGKDYLIDDSRSERNGDRISVVVTSPHREVLLHQTVRQSVIDYAAKKGMIRAGHDLTQPMSLRPIGKSGKSMVAFDGSDSIESYEATYNLRSMY